MEAPLRYVLVSLVLTAFCAAPPCVIGQEQDVIPRSIAVQLYLETSGQPLVGTHIVEVSWYSSAVGGDAHHSEAFSADVTQGVATVHLGSMEPLPVSMVRDGPWWLGIRVDQSPELTPRTPMLSVPYAFIASHALVADSVRTPAPVHVECGAVVPADGQSRFVVQLQTPLPSRPWIDARVQASTSIAVWTGLIDSTTNTIELLTAAPLSRHETLTWCLRW